MKTKTFGIKTYEVRISGELARTIEVDAEDANEAWLATCLEDGMDIPKPKGY